MRVESVMDAILAIEPDWGPGLQPNIMRVSGLFWLLSGIHFIFAFPHDRTLSLMPFAASVALFIDSFKIWRPLIYGALIIRNLSALRIWSTYYSKLVCWKCPWPSWKVECIIFIFIIALGANCPCNERKTFLLCCIFLFCGIFVSPLFFIFSFLYGVTFLFCMIKTGKNWCDTKKKNSWIHTGKKAKNVTHHSCLNWQRTKKKYSI